MKEKEFFFIQVSDLQFGMYRPGDDRYEETELVQQAVARINALAPDFVLCTGDIIDVPGSEKQMAHALGLLKGLDRNIPFLAVPGNHDIGDAPDSADLDWFRRQVGRDWFSFDHGGWHFVGLNSCLLVEGDKAAVDTVRQWTWLEEDLRGSLARRAAGILVFMHHPLFLRRPGEKDDYFNLPRRSRDRCLALFKAHGVGTVLGGHLHRCSTAASGEMKVVVSGPVGMPLGDGYSGLRLVRIGPGGLRHHYFALDDQAGQERFLA